MQRLFGITLGVLSWLPMTAVVRAEPIQTETPQVRHGRLYFPVGEERHVLPGSHFRIVCDSQQVLDGSIEYSAPGVAISAASEDSLMPNLDSCSAWVYPYVQDPSASIALGCLSGQIFDLATSWLTGRVGSTEQTGLVTLSTYTWSPDAVDRMLYDLRSEQIDGFLCTHQPEIDGSAMYCIGSPAPLIVVLMPNLSSAANTDGFLTSALYYQFDTLQIPAIFQGAETAPQYRLLPGESSGVRPLRFERTTGQRLLQRVEQLPKVVRIGFTDRSLQRTAFYFGDLLARSGIRSEVTQAIDETDCYVTYIPLKIEQPAAGLHDLVTMLKATERITSRSAEGLAIIEQHLRAAERGSGSYPADRSLVVAERRLIDDLGVLPLFRPHVFFTASRRLVGVSIDSVAQLDLSALAKLKPPVALPEAIE